ncbi:MAG: radical SAM protein [Planctomycetota bacterium]
MRKKLLLINPHNASRATMALNRNVRFPSLGLGIVAALTPAEWEIEILDENFTPFSFQEADLVGLTGYTPSINRAYQIAQTYRAKGIPTVLGGIHASMRPEEALGFVDAVVIGEAESVWPQVMADVESGRLQKTYVGTPLDLANAIRPRRDLFDRRYGWGTIQTARGCPMDCEFCSVTVFNGHRYRQRPVEDVLDELETIPQKRLFFADDNIIGISKESQERALALFDGMIRRKIRKPWLCQASMNFADNEEVVKAAARAGCRMVLIGVEAEDPTALLELNKKLNVQRLRRSYEETFRRINRHGIAILGAFIYGMDSDNVEALRRRVDYVLRSPIDVMQTTWLTPLPGTRLFRKLEAEQRLFYTDFPADWDRYDMMELTHRPLAIEPRDVAAAGHEIVHRLYSRGTILRKFAGTLRHTRNLTAALWSLDANRCYRRIAVKVKGADYEGHSDKFR